MIPPRRVSWSALLLVLAGAGGCVRAEKLDERVARAWCKQKVECSEFPDVRTCMAVRHSEEESYLDLSIAAGRIDYDGAAARRCVRAIERIPCHRGVDVDALLAPCAEILRGTIAPDEPCMTSQECVGERSLCGFDPGCGSGCCPGLCRYRPGPFAVGEACAGQQECEAEAACLEGRCAALPGPGAACLEGWRCAAGSYCNEWMQCQAIPKQGESCAAVGLCAGTSLCRAGVCAARAETGEACERTSECLRQDNVCDGGRCVAGLAVGASCGEETRGCVGYAFCREGACVEYKSLGESCDDQGRRCYPTLDCVEGRCERLQDGARVCPVPE